MGSISIWHWLIVFVVVLLFFGNRLPSVMGDFAKGIKSFKAGMKDDDEAAPPAQPTARPLPKTEGEAPIDASAKKDETVR